MNAEEIRLNESHRRDAHWKKWGPYVSERQWGTVREDYSPNGTAWEYFPEDICIRISVTNRGPDASGLDLLPTLWFRNTWSWDTRAEKPCLRQESGQVVRCEQRYLGVRKLFCEGAQEFLFTENETNHQKI